MTVVANAKLNEWQMINILRPLGAIYTCNIYRLVAKKPPTIVTNSSCTCLGPFGITTNSNNNRQVKQLWATVCSRFVSDRL